MEQTFKATKWQPETVPPLSLGTLMVHELYISKPREFGINFPQTETGGWPGVVFSSSKQREATKADADR
jgi:hypothetical protein